MAQRYLGTNPSSPDAAMEALSAAAIFDERHKKFSVAARHILKLPEQIMATPMGQAFMPMLTQMGGAMDPLGGGGGGGGAFGGGGGGGGGVGGGRRRLRGGTLASLRGRGEVAARLACGGGGTS